MTSRLLRSAPVRWPALAALLTLLIGSALVWLAGADTTIGQPLVRLARPITIYRSQHVGQGFTVPGDGLHRLDLVFEFRNRIFDRTIQLTITTSDGQVLLAQEYDAGQIRVGWNSFTFPALRGVAGQTLQLDVARDAPRSSALGLRVSPGEVYDGYGIFNGERDDSFDLAFRAYAANEPTPTARLARVGSLAAALTAQRPGLLGHSGFVLLLGGLYVVGLATAGAFLVANLRRP